jgi:ADP-ribose pyrophosphatase
MKILGEGQYVRLIEEDSYEYAVRKGCTGVVSVIAITRDGDLVFVEQYRPPLRARTIELVAGLAGDEGEESLEAAARRELLEETGFEADSIRYLMEGPSSGGITTSRVSYFLAQDVERRHDGGGVAGEDITVHLVPVAEAYAWLQQQSTGNVLVDPKAFLGVVVALHGWNGAAPAAT